MRLSRVIIGGIFLLGVFILHLNKKILHIFLQSSSFTKSSIIPETPPHTDGVVKDSELQVATTIHWNSTEHVNPPTVFLCTGRNGNGFLEAKKLLSDVFPEFVFRNLEEVHVGEGRPPKKIPRTYLQDNYTNSYDIFLDIFSFRSCNIFWSSWIQTHFNGHILLFSPESERDHPINHLLGNRDNMHSFGPVINPQRQDMVLTYLQMVYWHRFQDILSPTSLVDPIQRPKNNATEYMIYANSNCVPFREEAVGRLSEFGAVHCDGKCQGRTPPSGNRTNLVKTSHSIGVGNWWQNIDLFSNYRFCFVMEHEENHPAYITEKIMMAFVGGCIPIYHGPPLIFDIFNKDAFVFYNITEPEESLGLVKALNENKHLYDAMKTEPIMANGEETIEKYFSFSDSVGNGRLKREIREKFGLKGGHFLP